MIDNFNNWIARLLRAVLLFLESNLPEVDIDDVEEEPASSKEMMSDDSILWLLSAGHGSKSPNSLELADGRKFSEYHFNREVVCAIVELLEASDIRYEVLNSDWNQKEKRFIGETGNELRTKVNKTKELCKDNKCLLVDIHANATPSEWDIAEGVEVWFYKGSPVGEMMAFHFLTEIADCLKWTKRTGLDLGFKTQGKPSTKYTMLKDTPCPAVITENNFYNNPAIVEELLKVSTIKKIALAHVRAMKLIQNKLNGKIKGYQPTHVLY